MLWTDFNSVRFLDPWREFERMSGALSRFSPAAEAEFPAVNVWKDTDDLIVTSEIPGIDPQNIDISVAGKTLSLKGERKSQELQGEESYHRKERWSGRFSKTINLPFDIDPDKVRARYSKGILTIALSRAEADKPRKIEIRSE